MLLHVPRFCSSVVVAAIAEAALPVAVRAVGYPDELQSDALREPTGGLHRVPALTGASDDGPLLESAAILEFVLETFGGDTPLRIRPGAASRGKYMSLLAFSAATVKPLVSNQIFIAGMAPEPDTAAIDAAKTDWQERVGPFLAAQLGGEEYFVGGRLTAVDLALAKPLGNASEAGLLEQFPTLQAHFARVSARPSHALAYSPCEPGTYHVADVGDAYEFQEAGAAAVLSAVMRLRDCGFVTPRSARDEIVKS